MSTQQTDASLMTASSSSTVTQQSRSHTAQRGNVLCGNHEQYNNLVDLPMKTLHDSFTDTSTRITNRLPCKRTTNCQQLADRL